MQDYSDTFAALRQRASTKPKGYLRIDELRARQPQLEAEMSRPDLWDDADAARQVQTELSSVNDDLSAVRFACRSSLDDAEVTLRDGARRRTTSRSARRDRRSTVNGMQVQTSTTFELRALVHRRVRRA